jgi:glutamyl-tRNA synthetase
MIRTALFNWAFARHTGGTFVFRIEDTDAERDSQESYEALIESLRWLGLDWDEGPIVGGPYGPYRQSERMDIYRDIAQRLLDEGWAYRCYCTAEELEEGRERAKAEGRSPGYSGTCRNLSVQEIQSLEREGRTSVIRFRMPERDITWNDLVRGPITFGAAHVPDFVLVRANGHPLYTLVNPVDDALMRISHVLRGEDLLSSTPRQIALYEALIALGLCEQTPHFGHLPYVMGEGNKKLSKRDPESSLHMYREVGYLPEALVNYLALLGWSPGDDIEFFSMQQMADAFTVDRVNPNPARFDLKKCTAINADWIRAIPVEDLTDRLIPFLCAAGLCDAVPTPEQRKVLDAAIPLIHERIETLSQAVPMLDFFFDVVEPSQSDREIINQDSAQAVLATAADVVERVEPWSLDAIERGLREGLIDGLGLKPKHAFGPVRIAVTGRRISPPLFETMHILGRETCRSRIASARTQ